MYILEKIPNWLRWILSFPLALLAFFIAYPLIVILNKISMIFVGIGPLSALMDFFILFIASFGSAAAFVWVGAIVVPRHNFIVSAIYGILFSFLMGFACFAKLALGSQSSITWIEFGLAVVGGLIGAIGIIYHFYENDRPEQSYSAIYDDELY